MVGKQKSQISLLDSAFNARTKHCRTDNLLKKINEFVDWDNFETICKGMYKDSKWGRPSLPIIFALKSLILQYLYNLSDPCPWGCAYWPSEFPALCWHYIWHGYTQLQHYLAIQGPSDKGRASRQDIFRDSQADWQQGTDSQERHYKLSLKRG